jgi:hypothetical protein
MPSSPDNDNDDDTITLTMKSRPPPDDSLSAMPQNDEWRRLRRIAQIGQIGMEMSVPVALGLALDYWLGTLPWLTVSGAVLGPVMAFLHLQAILRTSDDK